MRGHPTSAWTTTSRRQSGRGSTMRTTTDGRGRHGRGVPRRTSHTASAVEAGAEVAAAFSVVVAVAAAVATESTAKVLRDAGHGGTRPLPSTADARLAAAEAQSQCPSRATCAARPISRKRNENGARGFLADYSAPSANRQQQGQEQGRELEGQAGQAGLGPGWRTAWRSSSKLDQTVADQRTMPIDGRTASSRRERTAEDRPSV